MNSGERPPADVFCMTCGPAAVLDRDPAALRVAHGIALNGKAAVLCTSVTPSALESLPARKLLGPLHFCNLDCPDGVLAERLRARPAWRHSSTEEVIVDHQRFAAWLREHIDPTRDTSTLTSVQAAERIAAWVRGLLVDVPLLSS